MAPRRQAQESDEEEDVTMTGPENEDNVEDVQMGAADNQAEEEAERKRQLREKLRVMVRKGQEQASNATATKVEDLERDMVQMDDIFRKEVTAPREAALDSKWLMMVSDIGAAKAKAMKLDVGAFEIEDYLARLIHIMGGEDEEGDEPDNGEPYEWHKIGRQFLAKSRRVPSMNFMLGPLSAEIKKRVMKKREKLDKSKIKVVEAEVVEQEDISKPENETGLNVLQLEHELDRLGKHVNLFKLFINPHDFAESVENLFNLSFLVRDGKCAIEWENGEPVVYTCDSPVDDDFKEGLKKRQMVFEFDMETWRKAIEVFDIKEPMIPPRPKPVLTKRGERTAAQRQEEEGANADSE